MYRGNNHGFPITPLAETYGTVVHAEHLQYADEVGGGGGRDGEEEKGEEMERRRWGEDEILTKRKKGK